MQISDELYAYPWSQTNANNCNTFVLGSGPRIMVDPGHAQLYGHVENGLVADGIKDVPALVVLTHCHPDHLEAAAMLQKVGSKLAMHPAEIAFMQGEGRALAASMGMNVDDIVIDVLIDEGELKVGDMSLEVILTPGHSPGHVCLHWPAQKTLIAGDLVFAQGVGRVDFPGGDGEALKASINQVAALDLELILTGHGPIIKGAESIKRNFEQITQMYFPML